MNDDLTDALEDLMKVWGVRKSALCCTANSIHANDETLAKNQAAGLAVERCLAELKAVIVLSKR